MATFSGTIVQGPESSVHGEIVDELGRPADATDVIFPIIQMHSPEVWAPIGTAFFISSSGLFATAKHVLLDSAGNPLSNLYGLHAVRNENRFTVRQVHKAVFHPVADAAIGYLFDKPFAESGVWTRNKMFPLTKSIPDPGARVVSWAFPRPEVISHARGVHMKFEGAAMEGAMEQWHPSGRDVTLLPGPCIRTSMNLAPGVSGGPVVFGDGAVFALNSTVYDGSELGYLTPISTILSLTLQNILLPNGAVREAITVAELADMGLIVVS